MPAKVKKMRGINITSQDKLEVEFTFDFKNLKIKKIYRVNGKIVGRETQKLNKEEIKCLQE